MKKLLLLLAMYGFSNASFGQVALSENFEGTTFPPTGWTKVNTHATKNWIRTTNSINGGGSAAVNWDAGSQDESLVSPSFSLVGYTSAYLNFVASVGYEYMVAPNPNGDLFAKISTDGGVTWTQLWVEENEGTFEDYVPLYKHIDLSNFVGMANLKVKFQYVATDADLVKIDDVSVTACPVADDIGLTALTDNTATTEWLGSAASYDFEWGAGTFAQGTGTLSNQTGTTFAFDALAPGSLYSYYVRANCGTTNGGWQGPFSFYTTLSTNTNLNYSQGFEIPFHAAGWSAPAPAAGGSWGKFDGTGALVQAGTGLAAIFGDTAAPTDAWLFSRGMNLTGGTTVTVKYFIREYKAAGNGGTNNLTVKIGTARTPAGQTTTLNNHTNVGAILAAQDIYSEKTATYVVPATGVYFLGFQGTSPAQTAAANGAILLDSVTVNTPLSTEEVTFDSFSVAPNPSENLVYITDLKDALVQGVTVADINGRTVKQIKYNNVSEVTVDISDLSTGMYLMTVTSDKGTATKKIVKK